MRVLEVVSDPRRATGCRQSTAGP